MQGLGGGVGAIAVTSLGAGGDKGETELRLPPRLESLYVVSDLPLPLPCLCLVLS